MSHRLSPGTTTWVIAVESLAVVAVVGTAVSASSISGAVGGIATSGRVSFHPGEIQLVPSKARPSG